MAVILRAITYLNNRDYRRRSFEYDAQGADGRVKVVNELIGRLNADWEPLRQAVAANTTGDSRPSTACVLSP